MRNGMIAAWALALAMVLPSSPTLAEYPDRPIRIILPIAPGSVTDVVLRGALPELSAKLGQQLIIDNRTGGSAGIIGAQACANAPADGYTLCAVQHNIMVINSLLFDKLPYNPERDFAPITRLFFLIEGLAVSGSIPVNSVAELKALAQSKPTALNFGTLGPGSYPELFLKWLNAEWKVAMVGVPYRGGGPIAQALAGGEIHVGDMGLGNFLGLLGTGKIKVVAVSTPKRSSLVPDVPTFREAGVQFPVSSWWGLVAPRGVPKPIIDRVNNAFVSVFQDPKFGSFLDQQAVMAVTDTPESFSQFLPEYRKVAADLIKLSDTPKVEYETGK